MRKNQLSQKDHGDLWSKVCSEGFGYYMLHYGPDLKSIEKLGFNKKEVETAIKLFREIENEIGKGEEFASEDDFA